MSTESNVITVSTFHYYRLRRMSATLNLCLEKAHVSALLEAFIMEKRRAPRTADEFVEFFIERSETNLTDDLVHYLTKKYEAHGGDL